MSGLPTFPSFDVYTDEHSAGARWNKYVSKLENLFVGMKIDTNKRKKALLLHFAGDHVYDVYETLGLGDTDDNYDDTKGKLKAYFEPKKNKEFEKFEFRNMKQLKSENIDQFTTRLRQKAELCEFTDKDGEIKSQIIQGCTSKKLRTKCLQEDKSLSDILIMARSMDIAEKQSKAMDTTEHNDIGVNKIRNKQLWKGSQTPRQALGQKPKENRNRPNKKCRNCGGNYPHANKCPAIGAKCNYCHKADHFIAVCRKRLSASNRGHLKEISKSDSECDSEDETGVTFGISSVKKITNKVPKVDLTINGVQTSFLVDTGSSLNVVSGDILTQMNPVPTKQKPDTKAYAFGQKEPLPIKGKYSCTVESESKFVSLDFYVIEGTSENLISYEAAVELGVVPVIKTVSGNSSYTDMCDKYKQIFTGLGKLKETQIKFHVDDKIVPTAQPPRRIPFHVRKQVENELQRLEDLDVIEKVDGPTPWVSNLVVAPKANNPNEIRVCVDMRKANQAIKRERHVTPTIDDILLQLNGSTVFSRVDLNNGFHQLELSPESRNMTTFATHVGLRRYKRLNFGVNSAPEIFQNEIRQALSGLNGVMNISDDIIIHGKSHSEHDQNLESLFERLLEKNLTLNKQKCAFGKSEIAFYGYVFSEKGLSPDPKKVAALKNADQPKSSHEVKSFLGFTNYLSRFIDNYSTITEPLRKLTQQDAKFIWGESQERAFQQLKKSMQSDSVLVYFDPRKKTELWVDGSPVGVSGILTQEGKVVAYGSRSLTEVEKRYSQVERETLACVFSVEYFHLYLFGNKFILKTDHRPILGIFNSTRHIQSARLERWRLRLTTYNFEVVWVPGKSQISDYLSRHPVKKAPVYSIAEDYVLFIANNALQKSVTLADIARATQKDCVLQCTIRALKSRDWKSQKCSIDNSFRCYEMVAEELSVIESEKGQVLLRGTRLCIPEEYQKQVVILAHEGHLGRVKTKALLRETCWFPYLDKLVDNEVKACVSCQTASPQTTADPIKICPLPTAVFSEVSVDFCGPFSAGEYYMVIIDDYSRYPIVEKLSSLSGKTVISRLESVFAMFGIPQVVRTDNGPPWFSHEFAQYAEHAGFKHRKTTPLHPMANGIVERFMQPLQKAIKSAINSGKSVKDEITQFLLNYRNTPHTTTELSPAEIMFGRKLKTKLPRFSAKLKDKFIRNRDKSAKLRNKTYADNRRNAKERSINVGDKVLLRRDYYKKNQTPYHSTPGTVVNRKGSTITIQHNGKFIARDISKFKEFYDNNSFSSTSNYDTRKTQDLRRSGRIRRPPKRYDR